MTVIADSSALVALLNRNDTHHRWARERWCEMSDAVTVCDAVLSEARYLLERRGANPEDLLRLWESEAMRMDFDLRNEATAVRRLIRSYRTVPMSLADACVVRMSEIQANSAVWTLDRGFQVYRRHRRQVIPVVMPEKLR